MKKPPLLILSDIHGTANSDWISFYQNELSNYFEIKYIDSTELAEVNIQGLTIDEVHAEFVQNGIERAVVNLLDLKLKNTVLLAFSIGGTIAWKAALQGLPVHKMVAISSTRLRKEYQKPKCEVELYFGEQDMNRPMDEWFEQMELYPTLVRNKDHQMYREESFANEVVDDLIGSL